MPDMVLEVSGLAMPVIQGQLYDVDVAFIRINSSGSDNELLVRPRNVGPKTLNQFCPRMTCYSERFLRCQHLRERSEWPDA